MTNIQPNSRSRFQMLHINRAKYRQDAWRARRARRAFKRQEIYPLIEANQFYAATFQKPELLPRDLLIVKFLNLIRNCIDQPFRPYEQLGLNIGAGGIIRNAGGSAHNALPGIIIVQQNYGGRNIAVFHHTDCGMTHFMTEGMREKVKKANPGRDDIAQMIDAIDFHHITD
ncbi:hypothetical protein C8R46DRAFT_1088851, partial [Mycena filopes]